MVNPPVINLDALTRPASEHTCHWPGCKKEVPPKMWGCKNHWYRLPSYLRARILHTYRPGQEITKTPSKEYLSAAHDAKEWILENTKADGVVKLL